MAITENTFTGNGSNLGPFTFTFQWLESTDIKVTVNGVLKVAGTHYNLQGLNYTTRSGGQVLFTAGNAPANGSSISIYRDTNDNSLSATFYSGSAIRSQDLNDNFLQNLYIAQETNNNVAGAVAGQIPDDTITTAKLADQAVTAAKIADGVTSSKFSFLQSGTGAISRTVESKLRDVVSFNDFGASGDAAKLNQALATGKLVNGPKADYVLEANVNPGTGAVLLEPGSTVDKPERLLPRGKVSDLGSGVNLWRLQDRVFIGGANKVSDTSTPVIDGFGIAGDPSGINSDYLERSAALISSSAYGGLGGSFAARQSLQYSIEGYTTWASGQSVTIGAKRGYYEKLYTATTSGTTGSTPPTHTTGTASDGAVTWQFDNFTYMVPIGLASVADSDAIDGHSCWALYLEGLRRSTGGTLLTSEIAVKNKGSNVTSNPYDMLPGGSTIGIWFAGGGDSALGAPANPSTAAIAITRNSQSWNTGIVFGSTAITSGGSAISLATDHKISWHATDGLERAYITSERTTSSNGGGIKFTDNSIQFRPGGSLGLVVDSAATHDSWLQITASNGFGKLYTGSSLANAKLQLEAKGTGTIRLNSPLEFSYSGFTVATTPANFTADRYMVVYDASGTAFYIPARLATW